MRITKQLSTKVRLAALLIASGAYGVVLVLFVSQEGAVLIGVLVPTLVAAYSYGLVGGLSAGAAGVVVNVAAILLVRDSEYMQSNLVATLVGAGTNLLLGGLVGWNRTLVRRLRDARRVIEAQVTVDELTGCFNRRYTFELLERRVNESRRYRFPLTVVFVDLDNLKQVNDIRGHGVGDELLRRFSEAASSTVRATDLVCRMGGDEFLLVLPHCDDACAKIVAKRVAAVFSESWDIAAEASFSFGAATLGPGDTADTLVERADSLMYVQKRSRLSRSAGSEA